MRLETVPTPPADWKTDLLVLIQDSGPSPFDLQDPDLQSRLEELAAAYADETLQGEYLFEPRHRPGIGAVVVYPTASEKGYSLWENAKTFACRAIQLAARTGRKHVTFALNGPGGAELVSRVAEGATMATWSFQRYKKNPKDRHAGMVVELAVLDPESASESLHEGRILAQAVNHARDLISEPGDVVTPEALAEEARKLAERFGFACQVWDENRLAEEGFAGLVKVGGGAAHPPRMIELTFNPDEPGPDHLVLLGKGVTFDSGGLSIKPSEDMHEMKGDMSGAAAVLGAMQVLGELRPELKVTALLVAAENAPDANAARPGDILVFKNGISVHIENTDAEGRLVLADGLCRAGEIGATHIVDIATLTGACARALGPSFTGLMGNNRDLVNAITRAGGTQGESYWKLPLPLEYKEMLKTPFADMRNVGGPVAGAMTAGLFLQEFVPESTAWVHLDIAGPFWRSKPWKYYGEGPTGAGVRTLAELARNWTEYMNP